MTALNAVTYLVGYLTCIAGIAYFIAHGFSKNPKVASSIAYVFFMFAIFLQFFGLVCDWILGR